MGKAIRQALFPYSSSLLTHVHDQEINARLVQEMNRLLKATGKIMQYQMMSEDMKQNKILNGGASDI